MSPATSSPAGSKLEALRTALKRLKREEYKVPPLAEGTSALERVLALVMQDGEAYGPGEQAVKALKRRFAHWNEVRVARRFEVKEALQKARVSAAERRAELAQEFLRRVFGLQNHLELDWLYDATSERRQKLLTALTMARPMIGPVLDLDAHEGEELPVTTNLRRLLSRLGLVPSNPKDTQVRELLEGEVSPKAMYPKLVALEMHAQVVCDSKHPRCRQCVLLDFCPHGRRNLGAAGTRAALEDLGLVKAPARKAARRKTTRSGTTKKRGTTRKPATRRKTTRRKPR